MNVFRSGAAAIAVCCAGCGGGGSDAGNSASAPLPPALQALRAEPALRQASGNLPSAAYISNDRLMDWAEGQLPSLFPGHAATVAADTFVYRYYPQTGNYLAVSSDNVAAAVLPRQSSQALLLGPTGRYFCSANPAVVCRPITPLEPAMEGSWPQGTYVARSDAEWTQAWATHTSSQTPPTAKPAVDFSQNMVLGVSLGMGAACGEFAIVRVVEQSDALQAEYTVWQPRPFVLCAAAYGPLHSFVLTPRSDKPVRFVRVAN